MLTLLSSCSAGPIKRSAPRVQRTVTRKGLDPVARSAVSKDAAVETLVPMTVEQEIAPQAEVTAVTEAENQEELNWAELEAELDAFLADNKATNLTTIVFPTTFNPEAVNAANEGQTFIFGGAQPSDVEVAPATNDAFEFDEAISEFDMDVIPDFDSWVEEMFGDSVVMGAAGFGPQVAAGVEHQAPPVVTESVSFFETSPATFVAALPEADWRTPFGCEQVPEPSQEVIPEFGSLPEVEEPVTSEAHVVDLSALFASTGVNFSKSISQGFAANDDHVAAIEQSWSYFKATGGSLERFREYPECWLPNLCGLARYHGLIDVSWTGGKQGIFFDTELKVIFRVVNEFEMNDAELLKEDPQPLFNGMLVDFAYEDALMLNMPMSDSEFDLGYPHGFGA